MSFVEVVSRSLPFWKMGTQRHHKVNKLKHKRTSKRRKIKQTNEQSNNNEDYQRLQSSHGILHGRYHVTQVGYC